MAVGHGLCLHGATWVSMQVYGGGLVVTHYRFPSPRTPRPSFVKLEQWLENLRLHLATHLPLGSQLEQLDRAFWETHRRGESTLPAHPEVPD